MCPSISNSLPVIRTASPKNRSFHVPQPTFLFPLETPLRLSRNMLHGWKHNSMVVKPSQHVPIYLQQFPSYSNRKCKKSLFSRTASRIFVSPADAPAIITQCVAWMERQFNACQTPHSKYFNSFRVIRCLSQCVSSKIAIFTTFWFPWGRPWGNHAKCCMDGKRIRCLQIVSLHVPI